jgi:hypothetical protein
MVLALMGCKIHAAGKLTYSHVVVDYMANEGVFVCLCVSLSLFHTHTHTHTQKFHIVVFLSYDTNIRCEI